MANRDTTSYRTSIQQEAPVYPIPQSNNLVPTLAKMGEKIIVEGQEAKITENFSRAQLDLAKVNRDYQTKYEGDPFGGLEVLKKDRDKILKNYENDISPMFRGLWQDNTRSLVMKDDAETEAWAYAQTKKNTVRSVNESIKNNMSQALMDGQSFGSDDNQVTPVLNFSQSKKSLEGFASKNLGSETAKGLVENYSEDYLKSFLSGVSESNPLKALRLMDDENIQNGFKDKTQFMKMKEAVESRALQVQQINGEKEVLNVLKTENSLLVQSLEKPLSYAQLQSEFDKTNMSTAARSFFMKANGYTKADGSDGNAKLSAAEQLQFKSDVYKEIIATTSKDEISSDDIGALQTKIYEGMNNKALSETEGLGFLNQLVTPYIDKKEQGLQRYGSNGFWFYKGDDLGYSQVQQYFDDEIAVQAPEGEDLGDLGQVVNNENKLKLMDNYTSALTQIAAQEGIKYGDIPQSSKAKEIYAKAQIQAKQSFLSERYPQLSNLKPEEWPDAVVEEDGRKISTGITSSKSTGSVAAPKPQYEFATEAEMEAANLPDGTPVMLGGVSGIYRK